MMKTFLDSLRVELNCGAEFVEGETKNPNQDTESTVKPDDDYEPSISEEQGSTAQVRAQGVTWLESHGRDVVWFVTANKSDVIRSRVSCVGKNRNERERQPCQENHGSATSMVSVVTW